MFSNILGSSQKATPSDDASLTTILSTPTLRVDFVLLVMLHADALQDALADVFDASQSSSTRASKPTPSSLIDMDDNAAPPSYVAATEGRGRSDYDRRAEELEDPELQELQRAAMGFSKRWRIGVLKRTGEVLKVRSDDVLRAKQRREAETGSDGNARLGSTGTRPIPTTLADLEEPKRALLLQSLLLLLLSLESYPAQSRLLLRDVAASLHLPVATLTEQENTVARGLLSAADAQVSAEKETKRRGNADAAGRAWRVGLATVAGAAVIGLTGGLAAPLLAAGVGTVMGGLGLGSTAVAGLLGALASNAVLVGGLFGAYGGKMTGQMMERYAKEVDDFKFLPIREVAQDQHRLRVAIGISGWLNEESDVTTPWAVLGNDLEVFALQYELDALLRLGTSLVSFIRSFAWERAGAEVLKRTVLGTIAAGLWPLGLLRSARVIDNPFSIARIRSDKAGQVLADALINRAQGERPVTLIGYSLGARVVYACLQELARRGAFGLVETAVFVGAPTPSDAPDWRRVRATVAGRVVNVYSANDFVLGILYRAAGWQYGVAGLEPVRHVAGVETFDASESVSGHTRYQFLVGAILQELGFEGLDYEALGREAAVLRDKDAAEKASKKQTGNKEAKLDEEDSRWVKLSDMQDAEDLDPEAIEKKIRAMELANDPRTTNSDRRVPLPSTVEQKRRSDGRIQMVDAGEDEASANPAPGCHHQARKASSSAGRQTQLPASHGKHGEVASSSRGAERTSTAKPELEKSDSESESEVEMLHVAHEPIPDE